MKTQEFKQYTLSEAYGAIKQNAEKFDWEISGELPAEPKNFYSQNQRKKYNASINRVVKKAGIRSINHLLYVISKITGETKIKVTFGIKEREIQAKRKAWITLRDAADKALADYKEEKGNFYKNILK
jgi:hypothetical protein